MNDTTRSKDGKRGRSDSGDDAPPRKASRFPTVLGLLNLLATGAVGAVVAIGGTLPVPSSAEDTEIDDDVPTTAVKLDPFVVNLNEATSTRYLKATVQLEMRGEDAQVAYEQQQLKVRDELLRYLSGLSVGDTLGEQAKTKIHDELLARVTRHYGEDRVAGLYFSEFVVQ